MPALVEAMLTAFDHPARAPGRLVLAAVGQDEVVIPTQPQLSEGGLLCKLLRVADGTGSRPGATVAASSR